MTTAKLRWYSHLLAVAVAGTLPACGRSDKPVGSAASLSGRVTVDGSATVFPLSKAMAEAFRESNPAVQFAIECRLPHRQRTQSRVGTPCGGQDEPMESDPSELSSTAAGLIRSGESVRNV